MLVTAQYVVTVMGLVVEKQQPITAKLALTIQGCILTTASKHTTHKLITKQNTHKWPMYCSSNESIGNFSYECLMLYFSGLIKFYNYVYFMKCLNKYCNNNIFFFHSDLLNLFGIILNNITLTTMKIRYTDCVCISMYNR